MKPKNVELICMNKKKNTFIFRLSYIDRIQEGVQTSKMVPRH